MIRISREQLSTAAQIVLVLFLLVYSAVKGNPDARARAGSAAQMQEYSTIGFHTQMTAFSVQHVSRNKDVRGVLAADLPGAEQTVEGLQQTNVRRIASTKEIVHRMQAVNNAGVISFHNSHRNGLNTVTMLSDGNLWQFSEKLKWVPNAILIKQEFE